MDTDDEESMGSYSVPMDEYEESHASDDNEDSEETEESESLEESSPSRRYRNFMFSLKKASTKLNELNAIPQYLLSYNNFLRETVKEYMKLWTYLSENKTELMESGLTRWKIGVLATKIAQLRLRQYFTTGNAIYLLLSYSIFEAVLALSFTEPSPDESQPKHIELAIYSPFLPILLEVNHRYSIDIHLSNIASLIGDDIARTRWNGRLEEVKRFIEHIATPLRYPHHPTSTPIELTAPKGGTQRALKLRTALLTSHAENEVKVGKTCLTTYRMCRCLEMEFKDALQEKHVKKAHGQLHYKRDLLECLKTCKYMVDQIDLSDPNIASPNPKKFLLYQPSAYSLLCILAYVCKELPLDSILLIYLSGPGNNDGNGNGLLLCPDGDSNMLYPRDIAPFTRRPMFIIIDSDNSQEFKVLHGQEMGERIALLLSPHKPSHSKISMGMAQSESQFTLFLTDPLYAFRQLVGLAPSEFDELKSQMFNDIINAAFSQWEEALRASPDLDQVWVQVLDDVFLRRLILRFLLCRAVLTCFRREESRDPYVPACVPEFPDEFSPDAHRMVSVVNHLAAQLCVTTSFEYSASA